jgi:hypothetical protein
MTTETQRRAQHRADTICHAIKTWMESGEPTDSYFDQDAIDAEQQKEEDWAVLELEARQFAEKYGAAAMLRCVSEVLK